jgi:metal-dependent amidase/aminoacylase/carboxypeptidase family protein
VLEKFKTCVKGAALATGAKDQIAIDFDNMYEPLMTNTVLMDVYANNMTLLGVTLQDQHPSALGGSSDIGNVSQVVPAIHPTGGIAPEGSDIVGHSHEFALAAKSEHARIGMMRGIQALAMCGVDLLGNPETLNAVKQEFQRNTTKK